MKSLSDKIKYYYINKKARPPKHPSHNRYNFGIDYIAKRNDLDNIPDRALVGGVEVACGFLVGVIPLLGCRVIAGFLITHGANQIFEGYMQEWERQKKRSNNAKRIEENINIFDFALAESEITKIDGLDTGVRGGPDPKQTDTNSFSEYSRE